MVGTHIRGRRSIGKTRGVTVPKFVKEREGRKEKSAISRNYPIQSACHQVSMIDKDIENLEPEVWKQYSKEITEGLVQPLVDGNDKPTEFFEKTHVTHLTGNANLTRVCMGDKQFIYTQHAAENLRMEVRTMGIQNIQQEMGRFSPATPKTRHIFHSTPERKTYTLCESDITEEILRSNPELNIRYKSTILGNKDSNISNNIANYFTGLGITEAETINIAKQINDMTGKETPFKYTLVSDNAEFRTLHYTVHVKSTSAETNLEITSGLFKIYVDRKMVLASLNKGRHENETYTIPLCEEVLITPYKFTGNEYALHSESCMLSAKLILTQPTQKILPGETRIRSQTAQQWHFFGDNAFTVHHANNHIVKTDPSSLTAFVAGFISGQLINISNADLTKREPAVKFFSDLFNDTSSANKNEYSQMNIKVDSEITKYTLSKLYNKYALNFDKRNANNQEDPETSKLDSTAFNSKVKPHDIPGKTFLANQRSSEMMRPANGVYPRVRFFTVGFSFSVMVISPHNNPSIRAVFVNTLPTWPELTGRGMRQGEFSVINHTKSRAGETTTVHKNAPNSNFDTMAEREEAYKEKYQKNWTDEQIKEQQLKKVLDKFKSNHSAAATAAPYVSNLPPELELELELI